MAYIDVFQLNRTLSIQYIDPFQYKTTSHIQELDLTPPYKDTMIYKKRFYNKCWGDTTTVSLPTLFFLQKISIQDSHTLQ